MCPSGRVVVTRTGDMDWNMVVETAFVARGSGVE